MLKIIRDLLRFNLEFAIGTLITSIIVGLSVLSFFSPYPPRTSTSWRPTCRRRGNTGWAPRRAGRTCSGR